MSVKHELLTRWQGKACSVSNPSPAKGVRYEHVAAVYDQVHSAAEAQQLIQLYKQSQDARWRGCEFLEKRLRIREAFERSKSTGRSGEATKVLMAESPVYLRSI